RPNAAGSCGASSAASSTRPSAITVVASTARTLIVCGPPSSNAISPTVSPAPAVAISTTRSPGTWSDAESPPATTIRSSRASSPWFQTTSSRAMVRRRSIGATSARPASSPPAKSGTVARKSAAAGSDIQVARLELEPGGRELGDEHRVLRHLEPAGGVDGERLRCDDDGPGRVVARHRPTLAGIPVLAPDRVPEADVREVGLEHLVLGRIPAVVEREARRDQVAAGADAEVHRRGGVDAALDADRPQDAQRRGDGVRQLAGLGQPEGVVELGEDERIDPLGVGRPLDALRQLGADMLDERV